MLIILSAANCAKEYLSHIICGRLILILHAIYIGGPAGQEKNE